MASTNSFDVFRDDDNDEPIPLLANLLVAVLTTKKSSVGGVPTKPTAKLPSQLFM